MSARIVASTTCLVLVCIGTCRGAILRTVALSGQQTPGLPAGTAFDEFDYGLIDSSGQVAFSGNLAGNGVTNQNRESVWIESSDSLVLAARAGNQAPGMPVGVTFKGVGDIALYSGGQTAFFAALSGGDSPTPTYGVWSGAVGALNPILRGGDSAPGLSGVTMHFDDEDPMINAVGRTATRVTLHGQGVDDTNDEVIWSNHLGTPALIVRTGDLAAGTPTGFRYSFIGSLSINSSNQVAFEAALAGGQPDYWNNKGIWITTGGSTEIVAHSGQPAPGTSDGVHFGWLGWSDRAALNASGQVAFSATLEGNGIDESNNWSLWVGKVGAISEIVRTSEPAPGFAPGALFSNLEDPVINAGGKIAFSGRVTGEGEGLPNFHGIWSNGFGPLALVARAGEQAPGAPEGAVFLGFDFPHLVLNSAGQTAFRMKVGVPNDIYGTRGGIWAQDRTGQLRLVALEGTELEVAPGELRMIETLDFVCCTGSDEGHFNAFNANGQLAFRAEFTNGSEGIFVSSIAAMPEPASAVLYLIAAAALLADFRWIGGSEGHSTFS